tara:strand:+ start:270 stop:794 length:525 start_codon:yes stop_codon:yes gene_type:complete
MYISANGKRVRTKLAEILVRMNYNKLKCLRLVKYPAPKTIRVYAEGEDKVVGHFNGTIHEGYVVGRTIQCYHQEKDQHKYFRTGDTVVETSILNDGKDEWYLTASRLDVQYSDLSTNARGFGSYKSGEGEKSPKFPAVHLTRIPAPRSWPVPFFLTQPKSFVSLNYSFYSEPGY